ncbi:hypothetical protein RF11_00232 [Thelohanellus kitauei]|uniref:Uncharacterized protein n=1 Tax=Thelohanellus kitauei TaxID=669202 RepID=A0A0C2NL56_THEKT|nr:hypothetical protein RF11_00232 [Thelohanellus kitauei]
MEKNLLNSTMVHFHTHLVTINDHSTRTEERPDLMNISMKPRQEIVNVFETFDFHNFTRPPRNPHTLFPDDLISAIHILICTLYTTYSYRDFIFPAHKVILASMILLMPDMEEPISLQFLMKFGISLAVEKTKTVSAKATLNSKTCRVIATVDRWLKNRCRTI